MDGYASQSDGTWDFPVMAARIVGLFAQSPLKEHGQWIGKELGREKAYVDLSLLVKPATVT